MKFKIVLITTIVFVSFVIFVKAVYKPVENSILVDERSSSVEKGAYSVKAHEIPTKLTYAGEQVPVHFYDVRERLDKELLVNKYWHSSTFQLIKRANRFFPVIEKILKEEGLPDDLKYLAVAESGLQNVVSPSRAAGFWQFLKGAANDFGLEVNNEIDERYHLEKATRAACKYLKWNYEKFGSWTLSAAAYNYGRSAVIRQMERQSCSNYYDLLLPDETERYMFRLIALKMILSNPQKFGFNLRENDLYAPIETTGIQITVPVDDLAKFAAKHGISYRMFKEFNPWLRENYLKKVNKKQYEVQIPRKHFRELYDHLTY